MMFQEWARLAFNHANAELNWIILATGSILWSNSLSTAAEK